jgi:hypothetical protein
MRAKLRLDLEGLSVDSFDTAAPATRPGTVFGEECTCPTNCTCPGCPTCDDTACGQLSCAETCQTCWESCFGGSCYDTCDDTCEWTCNWTCIC